MVFDQRQTRARRMSGLGTWAEPWAAAAALYAASSCCRSCGFLEASLIPAELHHSSQQPAYRTGQLHPETAVMVNPT